jgi:multimeric flavodoxin WrbA
MLMKNTIGILFSARKGNGYDISKNLLGEDNSLLLSSYRILHCQGCQYECLRHQSCPIEDDFAFLYHKLHEYDRWLVISPTYDGRPPALFYIFEERLPSFWQRSEEVFSQFYHQKEVFIITIGNEGVHKTDKILREHFTERNVKMAGSIVVKPSSYPLGGGIQGGLIQNPDLILALEPVKKWINS